MTTATTPAFPNDAQAKLLDETLLSKNLDALVELRFRWVDECEYEAPADYYRALAKILPEGWTAVRGLRTGVKRFWIDLRNGTRWFRLRVTSGTASLSELFSKVGAK